jgi:hypothetical protein
MEHELKLVIGCFAYVVMVLLIARFISTSERQSIESEFELADEWKKQKEKDGGIYEF